MGAWLRLAVPVIFTIVVMAGCKGQGIFESLGEEEIVAEKQEDGSTVARRYPPTR